MGISILLDTNAAIEFLGAQLPVASLDWLVKKIDAQEASLSVINQIELLIKPGSPADAWVLEQFIGLCTVLPLSEVVATRTIQLRQQYRIKLPDAIIGATALMHNLILITHNSRDFQHLPGIKLVDPTISPNCPYSLR